MYDYPGRGPASLGGAQQAAKERSERDFTELTEALRDLRRLTDRSHWSRVAPVLDEANAWREANSDSLESVRSVNLTLAKLAKRHLIESGLDKTDYAYLLTNEVIGKYQDAAVVDFRSTGHTWSAPEVTLPRVRYGSETAVTSSAAALQSPPPARQPPRNPLPEGTRKLAYDTMTSLWQTLHERVSPISNETLSQVDGLLGQRASWRPEPDPNDVRQNLSAVRGVLAALRRPDGRVDGSNWGLYTAASQAKETFKAIAAAFPASRTGPTDPPRPAVRRATHPVAGNASESSLPAPARAATLPHSMSNPAPSFQDSRRSLERAFLNERPHLAPELTGKLNYQIARMANIGPDQQAAAAATVVGMMVEAGHVSGPLYRAATDLQRLHGQGGASPTRPSAPLWQQMPESWRHQTAQSAPSGYSPPAGGSSQAQGRPGAGQRR
ncbi:hypothetical protein ACN28G_28540 [Micromonospora sp. WMMA1923]|uniref:hypothetical protein n=1 Tax=Micromonospora sp. WMMA1923 TaxID=3404125 RepID=UPI003B959057